MKLITVEDMFSKFRRNDVVHNHIFIYQVIAAAGSLIQGDPDDDNKQRVTPDGRPWMTSMGFRRKVRDHVDYLRTVGELGPGYDIYIRSGVRFNTINEARHDEIVASKRPKGVQKPKGAKARWASAEERQIVTRDLSKNFFDQRAFGQVNSTGEDKIADNATGPVQVPHLIAFDRAAMMDTGITCRASANEAQADQNMGTISAVQFALMPAVSLVNPRFAMQTGFTYNDLDVYLAATHDMWDSGRSNGRSGMELVSTHIFFHDREEGRVAPRTRAPLHKVRQAVKVERLFKGDYPTCLEDYAISYDPSAVLTDTISMAEYNGQSIFRKLGVVGA